MKELSIRSRFEKDRADLYEVMWRINERCNYRCEYCFRKNIDQHRTVEHPACQNFTPSQIADRFDNTGKIWKIHITGGEPFLYPRFVELMARLARRHYLSINTNLSTANVIGFSKEVDPEGVYCVYASLHLTERERRGGIDDFLEKILLLQDSGFVVKLSYIAYPPLLKRLPQDRDYFLGKGVDRVSVKVFRGIYQSRRYPNAFTPSEKATLHDLITSRYEREILKGKLSFTGVPCLAGQKAFHMDVGGNVTRCASIADRHGNLFLTNLAYNQGAKVCDTLICGCPYQGLKFAQIDTHGKARWAEKAVAYGRAFKRMIKRLAPR